MNDKTKSNIGNKETTLLQLGCINLQLLFTNLKLSSTYNCSAIVTAQLQPRIKQIKNDCYAVLKNSKAQLLQAT